MSSILDDIKSSLGIDPAITEYDTDVLLHTNSILAKLYQICDSSSTSVQQITDNSTEWGAVMEAGDELAMVKTYMYLSVRLLFDPPATSFAIKAMQDQQAEFEWRIRELDITFAASEATV